MRGHTHGLGRAVVGYTVASPSSFLAPPLSMQGRRRDLDLLDVGLEDYPHRSRANFGPASLSGLYDATTSSSDSSSSSSNARIHFLGRTNPQWPQAFYRPDQLGALTPTLELRNGDAILARCIYDSSHRSRTTSIGSTHEDEMCNLYLMYYTR
ncbi:unnamed protein product [Protopolystoma xenopodis]|uniref:Copper type II ascorbate-dependent monooxygenase C-terminal domain-containing protein n=1 Tax=Protopolystoma xenopodis TaxID=117903 RepID=A0A3S4ZTX7_9PLAT|nr:unnamed protein product [Protopolystoma xenopodis]